MVSVPPAFCVKWAMRSSVIGRRDGNESKSVFPQQDLDPEVYEDHDFDDFLL